MKSPCALARIAGSLCVSTKSEPEILKKSNAIPYTMHERMIIHNPSPGLPYANKPKRKTHAIILKNITYLIPNFLKKNGMAKMKSVSDICEIDIMIAGYFTAVRSLYL